MTKKQMHIRASRITEEQIEALARIWGTTKTDVVSRAVDHIYNEIAREAAGKAAIEAE